MLSVIAVSLSIPVAVFLGARAVLTPFMRLRKGISWIISALLAPGIPLVTGAAAGGSRYLIIGDDTQRYRDMLAGEPIDPEDRAEIAKMFAEKPLDEVPPGGIDYIDAAGGIGAYFFNEAIMLFLPFIVLILTTFGVVKASDWISGVIDRKMSAPKPIEHSPELTERHDAVLKKWMLLEHPAELIEAVEEASGAVGTPDYPDAVNELERQWQDWISGQWHDMAGCGCLEDCDGDCDCEVDDCPTCDADDLPIEIDGNRPGIPLIEEAGEVIARHDAILQKWLAAGKPNDMLDALIEASAYQVGTVQHKHAVERLEQEWRHR